MKILGLASSPRINGNTNLLLDRLLDAAADAGAQIERMDLARSKINACRHCDACQKAGDCVIKDDMAKIYPKVEQAAAIVLASPIYFMAHCAQAKLFIDRCQAFWARKYVLKQPAANKRRLGVFIGVGATHGPKVFAGAKITMKWLFDSLQVEYWADLLFEGLDERGIVKNHPTALEEAERLGRKLAKEVDKL